MQRNDSQCPFRIPSGKIPRISGHCRMTDRNYRYMFQLRIAADFRQVIHHPIENLLRSLCHIPLLVDSGSDPYQSDSHPGQCFPETRHLEQGFLTHIVLSYHYGTQLMAIGRYPQEGSRFFAGFGRDESFQLYGPLPFLGSSKQSTAQ